MDAGLQVEERTLLKRIDWNFVIFILGLNVIGLINLYSATHGPYSTQVEPLFVNQILWLIVGWSVFFIVTLVDYQIFHRLAFFIYTINVSALVFVTFFGRVALGGQRWIDLGFFHYQPSETMKPALILMLARVLSTRTVEGPGMGFKELALPAVLMLFPFILIVEQPDLGTAMTVAAIGSGMLLLMKIRKWIIIALIGLVTVAGYGMWNWGLRDYQKHRVTTFLDPGNDPRGKGYNSIQSKIAVGSGQVFGKGFRKGTQSQLEFLPERHTDFIFSVLSEEFGFFGSLLTIIVFGALFVIGIRIASTARDKFGALLTSGVLCYLFFHMFINVGMVIGLLPIVGVPLPLLSYGGSSMLTTMASLGLVSSVAYRRYLF